NPPRNRIADAQLIDAIPRQAAAPEAHAGAVLAHRAGRRLPFVTPGPATIVAGAPHHQRVAAFAALQPKAILEIQLDDANRQLAHLAEEARIAPHTPDRRAVELGADVDVQLLNRARLRIADQMAVVGEGMDARSPDFELVAAGIPVAALMPGV